MKDEEQPPAQDVVMELRSQIWQTDLVWVLPSTLTAALRMFAKRFMETAEEVAYRTPRVGSDMQFVASVTAEAERWLLGEEPTP